MTFDKNRKGERESVTFGEAPQDVWSSQQSPHAWVHCLPSATVSPEKELHKAMTQDVLCDEGRKQEDMLLVSAAWLKLCSCRGGSLFTADERHELLDVIEHRSRRWDLPTDHLVTKLLQLLNPTTPKSFGLPQPRLLLCGEMFGQQFEAAGQRLASFGVGRINCNLGVVSLSPDDYPAARDSLAFDFVFCHTEEIADIQASCAYRALSDKDRWSPIEPAAPAPSPRPPAYFMHFRGH